jgi:hypothetical protein
MLRLQLDREIVRAVEGSSARPYTRRWRRDQKSCSLYGTLCPVSMVQCSEFVSEYYTCCPFKSRMKPVTRKSRAIDQLGWLPGCQPAFASVEVVC